MTEWARERGCSRVYWQTKESNARARRLYDQLATRAGSIGYQLDLSFAAPTPSSPTRHTYARVGRWVVRAAELPDVVTG